MNSMILELARYSLEHINVVFSHLNVNARKFNLKHTHKVIDREKVVNRRSLG
jgi:hypothetical protein